MPRHTPEQAMVRMYEKRVAAALMKADKAKAELAVEEAALAEARKKVAKPSGAE